jgi:multidrug resistance efflux pump
LQPGDGTVSSELPNIDEVVSDLRETASAGESAIGVAVANAESSKSDVALETESSVLVAPAAPKPRGFQADFATQAPWPPGGGAGPGLSPPKPMPKRPQGRFLVGAIFSTVVGTILMMVWNAYLGVAAYGTVTGDTLRVTTPWAGFVQTLAVEEGQAVEKGQLLATVHSLGLERQLAQIEDELKVERARLDGEKARLRWDSQSHAAEYFELWGSLLKNKEDLNRLRNDLERAQSVRDKAIIPQQEMDRLVFAEAGQREMVEKMAQALEELRHRVEEKPTDEQTASDHGRCLEQLRPILARIDALESSRSRLIDQLEEGRLLSPVDGVVVRCDQAAGQSLGQLDTVLELVDSESLQATLYVQQDDSQSLTPGTRVTVTVEPLSQPVACRVVSSRERFESAPESVERYYRKGEPLLPVVLQPEVGERDRGIMRHGAIVRFGWFSSLQAEAPDNNPEVIAERETSPARR